MSKTKMPKSIKKFIRKEKSRIRKQVLDFKKQKELIDELYKKYNAVIPAKAGIQEQKESGSPHPRG